MAGRTGRASEAGIALIQSVMRQSKWTQAGLSAEANLARSTLNQILTGRPVKIDNLQELCHVLELEVGQVLVQETNTDVDSLVKQLRDASAASLRKRCGTMRILDMTQPIDSGAIYTDVNILERVAGKTRAEIAQLMADCGAEGFDRFLLGDVKQERVEGLKAVLEKQQLMILGRPGAGKTTFLKRLAIGCLKGEFLGNRLPIFVTLKEFVETEGQPGIVEFMASVGAKHSADNITISPTNQLPNASPLPSTRSTLSEILRSGRGLVLLDGLDEVMEKDHDRVIREIRDFAEQYNQNYIVITCRIAAREYIFQQFTEVEMADFDDVQIRSFADKWFKTKEKNLESTTGGMFWEELKSRKPLMELATNPLLLTLLCLEFNNSSAFPQSRSELYGRALHVLLSKWDGQRQIQRGEEAYKGLSLKRKETLLGQLAMYTFERGNYFFKEKVATQQIEQYIRNLPGAKEDSAALEVDSRAILKSIESRHGLLSERATGIYSFSHLMFQEYFAAKNILDISNPVAQETTLQKLIEHVDEKRWEKVFMLVVEGLDSADYLLNLMKQHIDLIIADDYELQQFLRWVQVKSISIEAKYEFVSIQSFYYHLALDLALARNNFLALALALDIVLVRDRDRNFDLARACAAACTAAGTRDIVFIRNLNFDQALARALSHDLQLELTLSNHIYHCPNIRDLMDLDLAKDPELKRQLQEIYNRLPNPDNREQAEEWWEHNSNEWREDLRHIMIKNRNIGHNWQFSGEQKQKLAQYYNANLLLSQCLNSECYVSREVREEIEATMLLPIASIEKWKSENRPT
jgi:predicted NACHT family NTPase